MIDTDPVPFSPCSTSVTLTANVTMTSGSGSLVNDYCYLWVPDKHIIGTPPNQPTPFGSSIDIDLTNLTTEAYQVYVYNDQCWASSAPLVIERSPISVHLGKDFTTCTSQGFILDAQVVKSPYSLNQTFTYKLTGDNAPTSTQTTSDFNITGLSAGLHTYTVEVWVNGVGGSCPATTDEIIVNVVNCCSCSSNVVTLLPISHENYTQYGHPHETYISETELINSASANPTDFSLTPPLLSSLDKSILTITGLSASNSTFCINGELWLRNEEFIVNSVLKKLVLQKCTLKLGPDAKIKIRGKVTLVLEGCIIEKCDGSTELWDGIYADIEDEATAEPEIVIDQYGTQPTQIRDAKNAIVIRRDSPYKIQYGEFTDNYIDIKFEKCKKITKQGQSGTGSTAMFANNYIRSCTFTSAGTTLITPYSTAHKFAAITLNDVERVVIGDSSLAVDYNIFSNSNYGINSYNSSFECYHSSFSDIFDLETSSLIRAYRGTSIFSHSDNDFNDRNIIIGNLDYDLISPIVTFNNVFKIKFWNYFGGEMNAKIYNNVFGNGNTANRIVNNCIWTNGSNQKSVYITRGNVLNDYYVGIRSFGIHPDAIYHIGYNNFNKAYIPNWSVIYSFQGTAIYMANSYASPTYISELEVPQINIYNNEIGQKRCRNRTQNWDFHFANLSTNHSK
ncbi:MAG: hypothetical protein IPK10_10315 [Bacteroidetes bacterium]|nr:hypothetical protein [Bacteroidota bacterium]